MAKPALSTSLAVGALVLLPASALAFWPLYLSRPFAEVDRYTHLHAAAGTAWLLMLGAQPLLIRTGRRAVHRAVGRLSYVLAPVFLVSGLLLAHYRFSRMPETVFAEEVPFLYLPISVAMLFAAAYGLAVAFRRNVRLHARFAACTALLLVDPVFGRIMGFYLPPLPALWHYQAITFGVEILAAVAMLRSLPTPSEERRWFRRFVAVFVLVQALWFVVPFTTAWFAFANWFRGLPVT